MYKLLIVDDEAWIRERLRFTIEWDKLDIEVIGEACDGEEALEFTLGLKPDIVLTDIRMPVIDGLEFIKKLRDANIRTMVIIISGYSDFEYAKKAIKLGAFDYILKPVEDDDLISVMKRCLMDIDTLKQKELFLKKAKEQIKESLPLLKKEFYLSLIYGYPASDDEIIKEFSYLGIDYQTCNNICFIAELDGSFAKDPDNNWDSHLLQFVMSNIIKDFALKLGESETLNTKPGEVICLLFSTSEDYVLARKVLSISNGIRKMIRKITGFSVTIGIGRVYDHPSGICESYKESREALQYKAFLGINKIYEITGIHTQHKPDYFKTQDVEILLNHIKIGDREKALLCLNSMITGMNTDSGTFPVNLKLLYMDIVNSVFKTILEMNAAPDDFSEYSYKFFQQVDRIQTVDEIHTWLAEMITEIIEKLTNYRTTKKRKVIEKAVEYITAHYMEPITLNSIANRFYMNASYFCKIFKEEMGESFTRYFMNLRIQKAMELLSDPTRKIYEIASIVGYEDVQYFTRIFKTIQGVTPMQYRDKIK